MILISSSLIALGTDTRLFKPQLVVLILLTLAVLQLPSLNLGLTTSQTVNSNLKLILSANNVIENATGGTGNDILTGNTLNNTLIGGKEMTLLEEAMVMILLQVELVMINICSKAMVSLTQA
ncbi:hypothetical protein [Nostoc sp.]